ncbi:hypothetical protein Tco_1007875 [Tanacetum coccineum]
MMLRKWFVKLSKLIYDKDEETVMFEKNDERVTFKTPYKMERFKDIKDLNTDNIPPFFVTSKGDEEKGEEDVSSFIDHYLGGMMLGKSFVKQSKLIYDKDEETVMFEKNDKRVTFKTPHKMERFKDIEDLNTDNIPPFFVTSKGDEEKGEGYVSRKRMAHYSECLKLGPEYMRDERVIKTIKFLNGRGSSARLEGVT